MWRCRRSRHHANAATPPPLQTCPRPHQTSVAMPPEPPNHHPTPPLHETRGPCPRRAQLVTRALVPPAWHVRRARLVRRTPRQRGDANAAR
eukprot:2788609-Prymnesium_polylepis.1